MFLKLLSFQLENLFDPSKWGKIFTSDFFTWTNFINLVDILVVWYAVYKVMMLVRGTKAVQVLKGVAVIIMIRVVSEVLGLNTVSWLMEQVITYAVIAAIIIFQPEVRRGLEHLGRGFMLKKETHVVSDEVQMIKALDKAIQYMSKRKIGALICMQRNTSLGEYVETGIPLDADISAELLINIFIPNTPLHDGAVIIQDKKISVACAYLPLTESQMIPKEFGTRHRAAIGLSEVSDAVTIIVSEETGDVSLAMSNRLLPHLSQESYLEVLQRELVHDNHQKKNNPLYTFFSGMTKGAKKNGK